jgi:plastocyanin
MHALATQLPVIVAAEKSRTAFYIVGSALVAWAFIVSLLFGLRQVDFPGSQSLERVVMAISAGLVIATAATGVITAGTPSKTAQAATPSAAAPSGANATTPHTFLTLEASKSALAYNTKQLTAKAGLVTITFVNAAPIEHNVTISKPGLHVAGAGETLGATPTFKGGTMKLTLKLAPGKYTFFCSVPGHRQAGMEGTITVQ